MKKKIIDLPIYSFTLETSDASPLKVEFDEQKEFLETLLKNPFLHELGGITLYAQLTKDMKDKMIEKLSSANKISDFESLPKLDFKMRLDFR